MEKLLSTKMYSCLPFCDLLSFCQQVILPVRRRRPRRRQGSLRWMRLCRFTGGTVMRRCTPAATSTQGAASTCSSLTTPIHSGAPRVFTTESTTPDKPEYRHKGSQGVCERVCECVFVYVCVCCCFVFVFFVWGGGFVWRQPVFVCACVEEETLRDLFWIKPPEGDKDTSGVLVWRLD